MKAPTLTLLIALIVLALWIVASRNNEIQVADGGSNSMRSVERTGIGAESESSSPSKSKSRVREHDAGARARQEFQDRFDAMIPPLDPGAESSICEVELQPGQGIVLGGFKTGDGHTKVTYFTPVRVESGRGNAIQYKLQAQTLILDDAAVDQLGLSQFRDGGRMRQQQFITTSPDMRTEVGEFKSEGKTVISKPTVMTLPDQRFTISMGRDNVGDSTTGMVSPVEGGEGVVLRIRMENDGRLGP